MNQRSIQWTLVGIMVMAFSVSPLAIDLYLPALPAMANDFGTNIDSMEASVAVYLFGFAIAQFLFGPVADRVNHTFMMVSGLLIFSLGSLLISFSTNIESLMAGRLLQAFGGGTSVVVYAMIQQRFDAKQSAQVISYIMAATAVAPMVAPVIGGEILMAASWQWIFYSLSGYALFAAVLAFTVLNRETDKPVVKRQAFSLTSITKSYREVFKSVMPMAHILTAAFAFAGLFTFVSGSPFVYIEYFGLAPDSYGYLVATNAVAMVIANLINARLLSNVSPSQKLIAAGMSLGLVGLVLISLSTLEPTLWTITITVLIYVAVMSIIAANAMAGAMSFLPNGAGTLSGINGVLMFGIGAVFSALMSAWQSTDASGLLSLMAISALLSSFCAVFLKIKMTFNQKSTNSL